MAQEKNGGKGYTIALERKKYPLNRGMIRRLCCPSVNKLTWRALVLVQSWCKALPLGYPTAQGWQRSCARNIRRAKGLYALQGREANLAGRQCAERLPSEWPELAHGFLAVPILGVSGPAENLLWVSSAPHMEGPHPLLWRGISTHTSTYNMVCQYLQAAKPQQYFFKTRRV